MACFCACQKITLAGTLTLFLELSPDDRLVVAWAHYSTYFQNYSIVKYNETKSSLRCKRLHTAKRNNKLQLAVCRPPARICGGCSRCASPSTLLEETGAFGNPSLLLLLGMRNLRLLASCLIQKRCHFSSFVVLVAIPSHLTIIIGFLLSF